LDAPDAVYRIAPDGRPLYGSEEAIFGEVQLEEAQYANRLAGMVRPLLPPGATILAPLAVGCHVDHQLARLLGRTLLKEGRNVAFYEELPYSERQDALKQALGDETRWRPALLSLPEEAIAAKVAAMAYYRTQVPVLYGDDLTMSRRIHQVARAVACGDGYAERIWWPA
ncbi:MAG: hypothetical protein ACRDIB_06660, partial [Ardenticatenaceae bacterium]